MKPIKTLSNVLYSFGEIFIDLIIDAFVRLVSVGAKLLRKTQTGSTGEYVFAMVIGIVVILFWKLLL